MLLVVIHLHARCSQSLSTMRNHLSHIALNLNANPSVGTFPPGLHSDKMPLYILPDSFLFCPPLVLLTRSLHISLSLVARNPEESRFFFACRHFSVPGRKKSPPPADGLANRLPISSVAGPSVSPPPSPCNGLSLGSELLPVTDLTMLTTLSHPPSLLFSSLPCHTIHLQPTGRSTTGCRCASHRHTNTWPCILTAHVDGHTNTENNRFKTLFNSRLFHFFHFFFPTFFVLSCHFNILFSLLYFLIDNLPAATQDEVTGMILKNKNHVEKNVN